MNLTKESIISLLADEEHEQGNQQSKIGKYENDIE